MPKRDLTYSTVSAHESLATASIFVCDGWTPSLLTTTATNFCCRAYHIDSGRFTDSLMEPSQQFLQ